MPSPHIALFDLYVGGHHLYYVYELARYWVNGHLKGQLDLVLPADAVDAHPALAPFIHAHPDAGVRIIPITEPLAVETPRRFQLVRNDREHGQVLSRYLRTHQPDCCMLMYFDHVQLSLTMGLRFDFPIHLAGLYFRPVLHYHQLQHSAPRSWLERLQHARKRLLLTTALKNPHFRDLFCLDPYAVSYINALQDDAEAIFLPDGMGVPPTAVLRQDVRAAWQVEPGRYVALLFGVLSESKGSLRMLEAIRLLPTAVQRQLCLVYAGKAPRLEQHRLHQSITQARRMTQVQVIHDDRFIPDELIQSLVGASDLMLVPYQRHVGSSHVLIRAAAEQIPVLGSSYGLVGEHIRRLDLGLAIDTTDAPMLAQGLQHFLEAPGQFPGNRDAMRRFAEANTIDAFCHTIFDRLCATGPTS